MVKYRSIGVPPGIMLMKPFFPIHACKQVSVTVIALYSVCSAITYLTMDNKTYSVQPPAFWNIKSEATELKTLDESEVALNRSTFVLETSRSPAQAPKSLLCSVESFAKENPSEPVIVLFNQHGEPPAIPPYILDFPNVQVRTLNYNHFLKQSPLKALIETSQLENSQFPVNHLSDALRVAILYRYGGIYLDTDMVALKEFPQIKTAQNFLVAVEQNKVGSAIMGFGQGHPFLTKVMNELNLNFNGSSWGANGPKVLSKVIQEVCGGRIQAEEIIQICEGISIFPSHYTYPFKAKDWKTFYDKKKVSSVLEKLDRSFLVHHFGGMKLKEGQVEASLDGDLPIYKIYRAHCPKTWEFMNQ